MYSRSALLIANGEYEDDNLTTLSAPVNDVKALATALDNEEIGDFDSVVSLVDPDLRAARKEISRLFKDKTEDDLIVLYFSGHGLKDELGRFCLAVRDTETVDLHATALQAAFISEVMDLSACRQKILILDCCNSGAAVAGSKDMAMGPAEIPESFEGDLAGRAILAAAGPSGHAQERQQTGGQPARSVFTDFLVKGLETGDAKPREDGDGISLDEAFDYAKGQVLQHGTGQAPRKSSLALGSEVFLTRRRPLMDHTLGPQAATEIAHASRKADSLVEKLAGQLKNHQLEARAVLGLERMAKVGSPALRARIYGILARHHETRGDEDRHHHPVKASTRYLQSLAALKEGEIRAPVLRLRLAVKRRLCEHPELAPAWAGLKWIGLAAALFGVAVLLGMLIWSDRLPRIDNSLGMELVLVPAGEYQRGSEHNAREQPPHQVTLTRPFYLSRHEVNQAQWHEIMATSPSRFRGDDLPVERVTFQQVQTFLRKLGEREGTSLYRLPTEAEWEYACRAGTTGDYAGKLDDMGWYAQNSDNRTQPVGTRKPNAWGLFDMHGNVLEWTADRYFETRPYTATAKIDPLGPDVGSRRVIRGGSLMNRADSCRCAFRNSEQPSEKQYYLGFRVARDAE